MTEETLNDRQKKFLDLLFTKEYINNPRQAAALAGYSDNTPLRDITKGLRKEILERTEEYLVLHAPKSAEKVIGVLDNPHAQGAKTALDAATIILDRVGISKKERLEVEHKAPSGVIIFPAKKD